MNGQNTDNFNNKFINPLQFVHLLYLCGSVKNKKKSKSGTSGSRVNYYKIK